MTKPQTPQLKPFLTHIILNTPLSCLYHFCNDTVFHSHPHLLAQVVQYRAVLAVVAGIWSSLLQGLSDLHLQLSVGLLQVPHCLQVVGQTVVQVLHGPLLVSHDVTTATTCRRRLDQTTDAQTHSGACATTHTHTTAAHLKGGCGVGGGAGRGTAAEAPVGCGGNAGALASGPAIGAGGPVGGHGRGALERGVTAGRSVTHDC